MNLKSTKQTSYCNYFCFNHNIFNSVHWKQIYSSKLDDEIDLISAVIHKYLYEILYLTIIASFS